MSIDLAGRAPAHPRVASQLRVPILLRAARVGDCETLTGVAHAAKRVWGYPDAWIERWRPQLTITPERLATTRTIVAEVRETIVGFAAVAVIGRRAWLEHLWVLPRAMRTGVGRALLDAVQSLAREQGARYLLIESDPNAEPFYDRVGAARIGSTYSVVDGTRRALPLLRLEL